jgi:hypothetical protein
MIKYLISGLLIFIVCNFQPLHAQSVNDSLSADSTASQPVADSGQNPKNNASDWVRPVLDSSFHFYDTVRRVSGDQIKSYVLNPDYAYANDSDYWKKEKIGQPLFHLDFLRSAWFHTGIFVVVMALVLWGIYQLLKESSFGIFKRKRTQSPISGSQEALKPEEDYDKAIQRLQGEGDYRLAIRVLYLRLIGGARFQERFQLRDSSTNSDMAKAFDLRPEGREFRYLTMAYEYIFYGSFQPGEEMYLKLKNRFDLLQQKLNT